MTLPLVTASLSLGQDSWKNFAVYKRLDYIIIRHFVALPINKKFSVIWKQQTRANRHAAPGAFPITLVYRKYVSSLSFTRLCQNPRYQSCFETLIVGWNFGTVGMVYLAIFEGIHSRVPKTRVSGKLLVPCFAVERVGERTAAWRNDQTLGAPTSARMDCEPFRQRVLSLRQRLSKGGMMVCYRTSRSVA
jgi:hypothetical protein